jgi:hypothetical protein
MEKGCGACGDGRGSCRQRVPTFQRLRFAFTGSRLVLRWLSILRTKPTLFVFLVFSVVVLEKCWGACGDREYYFLSEFLASKCADISDASMFVDQRSMGHTVAEHS